MLREKQWDWEMFTSSEEKNKGMQGKEKLLHYSACSFKGLGSEVRVKKKPGMMCNEKWCIGHGMENENKAQIPGSTAKKKKSDF